MSACGIIVQCSSPALSGWWSEMEPASKRNVIVGGVVALSVLTAALLLVEKLNHRSP
ncbi:MAG: hypothetical protein JRD89_02545 [Deltaproteobacteria bacterium]|nr:hypothetical protein [Deltaproteobacteria bacterium]